MKALSDEQVKNLTTVGGWSAAGCVALYLLYQYVLIGMYWGPRDQLAKDYQKIDTDNRNNANLIMTAEKDSLVWSKMSVKNAKDEDDAREQTATNVRTIFNDIASRAGISFQTWVDSGTHPGKQPDFQEIKFTASTRATSARLAGFLYAVEQNTEVPARIDQLNIHAQTPGSDADLHVEMVISALVYNPKVPIATRPMTTQLAARIVTAQTRRGGGTATTKPEVAVDPKLVQALMDRRQKEEEAAAKAQAEIDAFEKLSPEEKEAYILKKHEEEAAAATRKAAEDKIKQQQAEEEMMKRRLQDEGGAKTAPGGTK